MTAPLKASSAKVQAYLQSRGKGFEVKQIPASTRTAKDACKAIGCELGQIAKSLIFKDKNTGMPVLLIASGHHQVDLEKLQDKTNQQLSKADADFVREKVGYAIGGVPPVAHLSTLVTYLDEELQKYNVIWAAAGTPNSVFKLSAAELQMLTAGTWVDLAR